MTHIVRVLATTIAVVWSALAMAAGTPVRSAEAVDYTEFSSWLCRPDHNETCTTDLAATIVAANGHERIES